MTRERFILTTLLLVAFAIGTAKAQSMFGSLSGTVVDPWGRGCGWGRNSRQGHGFRGDPQIGFQPGKGFFAMSTLPAATYEVIVSAKRILKIPRGRGGADGKRKPQP